MVTSRKQAIAIGLSEARRSGAKVPPKKKTSLGESLREQPGESTDKKGADHSAPTTQVSRRILSPP